MPFQKAKTIGCMDAKKPKGRIVVNFVAYEGLKGDGLRLIALKAGEGR
jgi:hypothetical protein